MAPQLFADRFLRARSGEAIDLATARRAWIRSVAPGSGVEVAAWLARCAAVSSLWHPGFIPLADFGEVGRSRFFEAWDTPSAPAPGHGGPRTMPLPADGFGSRGSEQAEQELHGLACGLEDLLERGVSGRPRAARLLIPSGPRRIVLIHLAARIARLRGYVPVNARALAGQDDGPLRSSAWRALLEGRHVMVLDDGEAADGDRTAALFFVSLGLESDRAHLWLTLGPPALVSGRTVVATADSAKSAAVREKVAPYVARATAPALPGDPAVRLIGDAIASGRHARAERLLRDELGRLSRRRDEAGSATAAFALGRLLLVRGRTACAGRAFEEARERFDRASLDGAAVRAAIFVGLTRTDAGGFAPAEAVFRAAAVAASRLSDPELRDFADLGLARCLLWQGRPSEASEVLARSPARPWGIPMGLGSEELARVAERAEPAIAGERSCGGSSRHSADDWRSHLWAAGEIGLDVARLCLSSRIAIAERDVERAGRCAAEARQQAQRDDDTVGLAAACTAKAAVYGALGDLDAVRDEVKTGLLAARRAHAPLRALRLRIIMAKSLREIGHEAECRRWLARLSRLDLTGLPKVVALPLERVIHGNGMTPCAPPSPAAGLPPTGSAAPGTRPGASDSAAGVVGALVEVLRACQSSDDEAAALERVAATLRERTRAVAVGCFSRVRDEACLLAADGRDVRGADLALRAIDSGLAVAPTATVSGLEAAVPIRFAGALVGAFTCRFGADAPPDWPSIRDLVTAAATAVGPCVRTLVDRRALPASAPDTAVSEILGGSEAVANLRRAVLRAAAAPFNVVVEGESGSGKELVARALHRLGPRRDRPLCALNCAALADDLVEAELFGHARGAFTGAIAERKGLFEEADHGVLVLDEVGDLSGRAQAKLLRAIQEGEVRRVGENFCRPVDVRIVAATNRPLCAAVESGQFRRDLLYRLEVVRIVVPPLRSRAEDIPMLAGHFWLEATARVGSRCTLAPATLAVLARYEWPGNVRELQNVMAALAVAAGRRGSVGPEQLPPVISGRAAVAGAKKTMAEARRVFETGMVRAALARAGGHRVRAAAELGLTRQGLAKLMARLGIE